MWVLLSSVLGAGLAVAPPDPSIAVQLDGLGTVHGVRTGDKHLSFMGIPYAEPPVGDNRWQPPVPKQPWDGILRAFSPGRACAQGNWNGGQVDSRDSYLSDPEDCLFLNVYVPLTSTPPPGGYPVMVYVHGGGYEGGSGGGFKPLSWYEDGIDDLIFVSMNYRMGIWGFLGSEELQASSRDGSTGNYGQQDQREAFKWVQTHIAQFGGNPDRMMIWGQSSGAASVSLHLVSPRSWGLFKAAGMDSGGSYMPWSWKPKAHAQKVFNTVALWLNCTGAPFPPAPLHDHCYLNSTLDKKAELNSNCTALTNQSACTSFLNGSRVPVCYWVPHGNRTQTNSKPHNRTQAKSILSCLRNTSWEQLRKWSYKSDSDGLPYEDTWDSSQWAPVVDGVELPMPPPTAIESGHVLSNVTVVLGSNADEGNEFIATTRNMTIKMRQNLSMPEFEDWLQKNFLAQVFKNNITALEQLHTLYPVAQFPNDTRAFKRGPLFSTPYDAAVHLLGDYWATCNQRRAAQNYYKAQQNFTLNHRNSTTWDDVAARPPARVFQYFFAHAPLDRRLCHGYLAVPPNNQDGCCHSSELPFAYGDYSVAHDHVETRLIYAMSHYYTNVAISGDPNLSPRGRDKNATIPPLAGYSAGSGMLDVDAGKKLPIWRPYTGPPEHYTQLLGGNKEAAHGEVVKSVLGPHSAQCDFWDAHPPSSGWADW